MTDPLRIAANVAAVRADIAAACGRCGRDPGTVALIAVTKNQQPEVLEALRLAGITDFAENRIEHLQLMTAHTKPGDQWHYIGRVQGRQLAKLAPLVNALHSLCDPEHVGRLARACIQGDRRLPVYIQVNTSGEAAKAGLTVAGLAEMISDIRSQPALDLAGLMTMAPELGVHGDAATVRTCFSRLRELAVSHGLSGLSMGMSGDLGVAIEEGATVVRVGSRLFA